MKKRIILETILICLGLGCWFYLSIMMSNVKEKYEGILPEPFMLAPIGLFLIILGLFSIIGRFVRKKIILESVVICLGLACILSYSIIGSHLDDQGILREPFALIPIGYFFIALGLISIISRLIMKIFNFFFKKR
jgi:hypothetical protein